MDIPQWQLNLISIAFGLVVGSFVNVIIHRLPRGQSVVRPRSKCPHCEKPIAWYDNFPVLSYFVLGGKCRHCKTSVSIRYPVIELITALLFLAMQLRFGFSWLTVARDWPLAAILVSITFIDLEHRIIPDPLSLGGLGLGLLTSWAVPEVGLVQSLIGAGIGFFAFYAFAWVYWKITGRNGLGGGDIKLLAMVGAFMGPPGVFSTILVSSVLGSTIGILWGLLTRKKGLLTLSIPYGPFLVLGALVYYLLGDLIWLPFTIPT